MVSGSRKIGNRLMRKRYCRKLGYSRQWTTYEVHESEVQTFDKMNGFLLGESLNAPMNVCNPTRSPFGVTFLHSKPNTTILA